MNWKKPAMTLICAMTFTLAACGANEYGQENNEYNGNNTQPIGYNQTSNDPIMDRANNRNQTTDPNQGQVTPGERDNNRNNQFMFDGRNNRNNPSNVNNNGMNNHNYELADDIAEDIQEDVSEVGRVYVLTNNDNAYVAASWEKENNTNENDELSDQVKSKITKIVKSKSDDIDNVYITTNPDFFDLTDNYANDIEDGEPIEGFFRRIGNMVDRVFPDQQT